MLGRLGGAVLALLALGGIAQAATLTISGGAPKGSSLAAKLGVVTRPDGGKQVTYNGKLLYTFYEDQPGQVGGDGFDDAFGGQKFTWHVVHANGVASSPNDGDTRGSGFPGY